MFSFSFTMEEIHLEATYDELKMNDADYDEDDNIFAPFQFLIGSHTQCGLISSDDGYDASDPTHSNWNYAGGPGFLMKIEGSSPPTETRTFQCDNTEV